MAQQCPLLFRQVDATVTRINTLFVMSGVVAYLFSGLIEVVLLVIGDFLLRLYGFKHISPTQTVSLWIQRLLSLPAKMEDAGAKRLAGYFGAAFMAGLALFHWMGMGWAVHVVAGVYLAAAALDLFFGYCIACKIYYFGKKIQMTGGA